MELPSGSGNSIVSGDSEKGKEGRRVAEEVRKKGIVTYQKQITADEPDAYAEVNLKFEGLQESRVGELWELFNKFAA